MNINEVLQIAINLHNSAKLEEAKKLYLEVLAIDKFNVDALYLLGALQVAKADYVNGVVLLEQSLKIHKKNIHALINLAHGYEGLKEFDKAYNTYLQVIKYSDKEYNYVAYNQLGMIAQAYKLDLNLAKRYYLEAIKLNSNSVESLNNLGFILRELKEPKESIKHLKKAISINPNFAEAHNNLALAQRDIGEFDEAIKSHINGMDADFSCFKNILSLAILYLTLRDYKNGWKYYYYRDIQAPRYDIDFKFPADLSNKRVLLKVEQGIGDELFFLRFVKELKLRGAFVTYISSENLKPVLEYSKEIDLEPKGIYDYELFIGDLPLFLGIDKELEPFKIEPNIEIYNKYKLELNNISNKPKIAITYRAGRLAFGKLYKNIDLKIFAKLFKDLDVELILIQREPTQSEIEIIQKISNKKVYNYSHLNNNLEEMVGLLFAIDNYISVSNTNLHLLAGLENRKAEVLVPFFPEWRWQLQESSKWFPNFNIYREDEKKGFDKAVLELKDRLKAF